MHVHPFSCSFRCLFSVLDYIVLLEFGYLRSNVKLQCFSVISILSFKTGVVKRAWKYPWKDERLNWPWSFFVVWNLGPLDRKSSSLTTKLLLHKLAEKNFLENLRNFADKEHFLERIKIIINSIFERGHWRPAFF